MKNRRTWHTSSDDCNHRRRNSMKRSQLSPRLLIPAVAALAMLAMSCGDDSTDSSSATGTASADTSATTSATTSAGAAGTGASSGQNEELCTARDNLNTSISSFRDIDVSGGTDAIQSAVDNV